MISVAKLDDIKIAVLALKKLNEVMAIEYLDKKNTFGMRASIDEMSKFRTKMKKQDPVYDPFPE